MNSNLKKLFGFAAITACSFGFAMNVHAADAYSMDEGGKGICTATTMEGLKECASGKVDNQTVKSIVLSGISTIDADIKFSNVSVSTESELTIASKVTLVNSDLTGTTITVANNAVLDVSSYADVAVKASTLYVKKGTVKVNADNTKGVTPKSTNDAIAISTATLEADGSIITVTAGSIKNATEKADITLKGQTKLTIVDAKADIEADAEEASNTSVIKANEIDGKVTLADSATLTAKKVTDVVATDKAKANVDEITKTVEVDGEEAVVQFASDDLTLEKGLTLTQGVIKKLNVVEPGVSNVLVYAKDAAKVEVKAGEVLVVSKVDDVKDTVITGNGKIDNQSGVDVNLLINTEDTTKRTLVSKDAKDDKAFAISNGQTPEDPTDPVDPTDPTDPSNPNDPSTGDDQPSKNPQTFDAILSYVGMALSSVGGLGVSLKKRLFR